MSSVGPPNKRLRQTCLSFASSGPKRPGPGDHFDSFCVTS